MKPKILILTDWYLPGTNAGGPVRSIANMIAHLKNEFLFKIITRDTDYCENKPYPDVKPDQWTVMDQHAQLFYLSSDQLKVSRIKALLKSTSFDVLYINGMYSWWFSILPLILSKNQAKKTIVAPRGMLNPQAFSTKKFKKKLFIRLANLMVLYRNVIFQASNEDEKGYILANIKNFKEIKVIPNLPRKNNDVVFQRRKKETGFLKCISIARISPEKGTLRSLQYISKIANHNIHFSLFGSIYDHVYWKKCEELINNLPENITVEYYGPIEGDKVHEKLLKAHFLLMPSEGENFGHSIIEALSAGCPVIISDQTPWKNLEDKKVGWDIPLKQVDQFVRTIENAASMSQVTYDVWSANAFKYAENYYQEEVKVDEYMTLFAV